MVPPRSWAPENLVLGGMRCNDWQLWCLPACLVKRRNLNEGEEVTAQFLAFFQGNMSVGWKEMKTKTSMKGKFCCDFEGILLENEWVGGSHVPCRIVRQQFLCAISEWHKLGAKISKKFWKQQMYPASNNVVPSATNLQSHFDTLLILKDFRWNKLMSALCTINIGLCVRTFKVQFMMMAGNSCEKADGLSNFQNELQTCAFRLIWRVMLDDTGTCEQKYASIWQ